MGAAPRAPSQGFTPFLRKALRASLLSGCRSILTRKTLLLATLLLATALPSAAAQDEDGSVTVWTAADSRHIAGFVDVPANTTLIVRGATLELEDGFNVALGGTLILEEGTVLKAGDENGWLIDDQGTIEVRGTATDPVRMEGLGGSGQNNGDTILFSGGIIVGGGVFDARHLHVTNYTSGIKAAWNSSVRLTDVFFNSSKGLGLVASQGMIEGERLTLRGRGAAYWAVADGHAVIRNSTFEESGIFAIVSNGNETIVENVRVLNSGGCVRNTVGRIVVRGLHCEGFQTDGVVIAKSARGTRLPEAEISGARIFSSHPNASTGVAILGATGHRLSDLDIGPVGSWGLVFDTVTPRHQNVTFHEVGRYNIALLNPQVPAPPSYIGEGAAGAEGWLFVGYPTQARIVDPDGAPVEGAYFEGRYDNGTLAFRKTTLASGLAATSYLPLFEMGADRSLRNHTYDLRAYDPRDGALWSRDAYVPDGEVLLVRLAEPLAPTVDEDIPGPSLALLLGALVVVATALRYRRSRI